MANGIETNIIGIWNRNLLATKFSVQSIKRSAAMIGTTKKRRLMKAGRIRYAEVSKMCAKGRFT